MGARKVDGARSCRRLLEMSSISILFQYNSLTKSIIHVRLCGMWDVHLSHKKLYGHMWAPHLSYATDVDVDGAGVVCSVTVPEHNNFPTLGNVANYISLEMALQQIA